jgi:hypothetical protein|tara:strand:- start:1443 stop:1631 length:189 start_codon:yes stop_codon:yes gene_type:complete
MDRNSRPVTMEEMQSQHDEWWDSLTSEEKEKLFHQQKEAEDYFYSLKQSKEDFLGPNSHLGV